MTETALILLLKLSEIPKSYIYTLQIPYPRRLSHKGNNSNSLPYSACKTIALSMQSLRPLLQPPIKIYIVNHTNTCKANCKQLTAKKIQ